jgi:hypothetical protein
MISLSTFFSRTFLTAIAISSQNRLQKARFEYLTVGAGLKNVVIKDDFYIFNFWQVKNSREKNRFFTLQNNST